MKKIAIWLALSLCLYFGQMAYATTDNLVPPTIPFATRNLDRSPWDYEEWIDYIIRYFATEDCVLSPGTIDKHDGVLYWYCEVTGEWSEHYDVYVIFNKRNGSSTINEVAIVCPYTPDMQTEIAEKLYEGLCWICLREISVSEDNYDFDGWFEEARWDWLQYYIQGDEIDHPYTVRTSMNRTFYLCYDEDFGAMLFIVNF